MVYLSVLSFLAALMYLQIGFTAFFSNRSSRVFRVFLLQSLSFALWAFSSGFTYLATNAYDYAFWNKLGAFGWCTFEALLLYFVLLFTGNKFMRYKLFRILILTPALVFLYMALFLFGPDIKTSPVIEKIFYIGDFFYNFIYLGLSILLIILWGKNSKSRICKKQAMIISVSGIIPFLLNLLFAEILPAFGVTPVLSLGQIFSIIMFLGINYAMTKYQFLSIPTTQITFELFQELTGLTFLLDAQGYIMKANKQVYSLFDCSAADVLGRHISDIIGNDEIEKAIVNCDNMSEKVQFDHMMITTKPGETIPFHISIVPLHSSTKLLRGILLIGEDIRPTLKLHDEIEGHKRTNERLKNSELLFRKILEITPVAILLVNRQTDCLVYLNNQAARLLGAENAELIGNSIRDFFVNPGELDILKKFHDENNELTQSENQLKRKDGSVFTGLISAIPSIFNDEDVALSCIVDMTDQKKAHEELERNNERIQSLNAELMALNHDLMTKSIRDGLTNLYNHQYINETLELVMKDTVEFQNPLCIMMMDIDHFKKVNDRFGHITGDVVLSKVAELILTNAGGNAYTGRYGGEEFMVVLPKTGIEKATEIAETIRYRVEKQHFGNDDLRVTISIGVAQYDGESATDFINKADQLLYLAKRNGRNRLEYQTGVI